MDRRTAIKTGAAALFGVTAAMKCGIKLFGENYKPLYDKYGIKTYSNDPSIINDEGIELIDPLTINGVNRYFTYQVSGNPADLERIERVVFTNHGAGGGGPQVMRMLDLYNTPAQNGKTSLGKKHKDALYVFITGTMHYPEWEGITPNRAYNAGYCCGYAVKNKVDDIQFLKEVVNYATHTFNIPADRLKVNSWGVSNGGMLSYRAAVELLERYGIHVIAIGDLAGAAGGWPGDLDPDSVFVVWDPNTIAAEKRKPISLITQHGSLDTCVLYGGGKGGCGDFIPFSQVAEMYKNYNNLIKTSERNLREYSEESYAEPCPTPGRPPVLLKARTYNLLDHTLPVDGQHTEEVLDFLHRASNVPERPSRDRPILDKLLGLDM